MIPTLAALEMVKRIEELEQRVTVLEREDAMAHRPGNSTMHLCPGCEMLTLEYRKQRDEYRCTRKACGFVELGHIFASRQWEHKEDDCGS